MPSKMTLQSGRRGTPGRAHGPGLRTRLTTRLISYSGEKGATYDGKIGSGIIQMRLCLKVKSPS